MLLSFAYFLLSLILSILYVYGYYEWEIFRFLCFLVDYFWEIKKVVYLFLGFLRLIFFVELKTSNFIIFFLNRVYRGFLECFLFFIDV